MRNALFLDGASSQKIVTPTLPQLDQWSIAFWARTLDDQGDVINCDSPGFNNDLLIGVAPDTGFTDNKWGVCIQRATDSSRKTVSSRTPVTGVWQHIVSTYDGEAMKIYVDGVLEGSTAATNCFIKSGVWQFAQSTNSGRDYKGALCMVRAFSRALSTSEVSSLYATGKVDPTSQVFFYRMDDGTDATIPDSTGNGYAGTLTSVSATSDVPFADRVLSSNNLMEGKNGRFEVAPPTNAVLSTNLRWYNGAAGGSTVNDAYGIWARLTNTAIVLDSTIKVSGSYSLKISSLAPSPIAEIQFGRDSTLANVLRYGIPVIPGATYTARFWMKTIVYGGDSNHGSTINFLGYNGAGTNITNYNSSGFIKTTTDWTQYLVTITTGANDRFIMPFMRIYGHTGAGTLVMDAWFDEVEFWLGSPQ